MSRCGKAKSGKLRRRKQRDSVGKRRSAEDERSNLAEDDWKFHDGLICRVNGVTAFCVSVVVKTAAEIAAPRPITRRTLSCTLSQGRQRECEWKPGELQADGNTRRSGEVDRGVRKENEPDIEQVAGVDQRGRARTARL